MSHPETISTLTAKKMQTKTVEQFFDEMYHRVTEEDKDSLYLSLEEMKKEPYYPAVIGMVKAYARQALEIAAEKATVKFDVKPGEWQTVPMYPVDKDSILNIELP